MLKRFSARTCAFDVEWIPCPDTARRLLDLPASTDDRTAIEAVWRHYATEKESRPFLKLALCRVVSIAAIMRAVDSSGNHKLVLYAHAADHFSEAEMIQDFLETVGRHKPQLWGFNSGGADLPILVQRAVVLGLPCPEFSRRPAKPWEGDDYFDTRNSTAHMDILQVLAGYAGGAARPSLHEIAVACGIPGKLDVKGADVADLYLQGEIAAIAAYNEADAFTTDLLMLRIAHQTGHLSAEQYGREIAAVEALLDAEIAKGKPKLRRFQDTWRAWRTDIHVSGAVNPGQ